ncbi:hypothetical protein G6M70_15750 [Agrobacterium tumefaciens]|uniref:hypothetical protein n=1 Tax=Agrobacterium tumefaciens TaxID=358 RepID=UPI001573F368|nr:hypothetical protein [Agrobacterium tumefaciens]NSZ02387.1 hypothetical protein [Agrobacterium tumefaciens]NSZ39901.1 hypothetical protein [Agrobacterium tumefaciens]NTB22027.1 hypothetical protein [Agrobacterium tumefaciens]NTB30215.1 hypothetical protein [Agrobacterium tumefaciens]NTB34264.1 hypothetical protein [Agrobacterium tumefaciens]
MAALRKRIVCRQYMEDHSGSPFTLASPILGEMEGIEEDVFLATILATISGWAHIPSRLRAC